MAQLEEHDGGTESGNPTPDAESKVTDEVRDLKQELEEKVLALSQTNRQLKRKIFDLYTIFEISRNFNSVLDYKSLLESFIFTCLGQVGALKGAIFLKRRLDATAFHLEKAKGSGQLPDFEGKSPCI